MPEPSTLALFFVAAAVLLLTPGPAVLYIVARSIDQGRTAGLVSVLGIGVGTLFHVAAAVLGLSALLGSSALAFNLVKYLGAAYLICLGVRTLGAGGSVPAAGGMARQPLRQVFLQGVVVNLLNPKTALFFLAFLPQFVDRTRGGAAGQILLFGLLLVVMGAVSDGAYALTAGMVASWLKGNARFVQAQRYGAAGVYIGLGITAALARPR